MKTITLLLFFLLPIILMAQEEASFKLYFEDFTGNKDTLILGYDENATNGIDVAYGEENIISQLWSGGFEVRISDAQIAYPDPPYSIYSYPNSENFHSKKQIIKKDCLSNLWNSFELTLLIKNAVYPVKFTINSDAWVSGCSSLSFVTDLHPGCWFDCSVTGTEYLIDNPIEILNGDIDGTVYELTQSTMRSITDSDTLDVFWIQYGGDEVTAGLNNLNPQTSLSYIVKEGSLLKLTNDYISCVMYNSMGQQVRESEMEDGMLNCSNLEKGIYYLFLGEKNNNLTQARLIIL